MPNRITLKDYIYMTQKSSENAKLKKHSIKSKETLLNKQTGLNAILSAVEEF